MQVAGQSQINYAWDDANRLTGVTQGSTSVGIAYDNANRRTSLMLPNGVTVGYSVDNDSRITGLTYSAGSSQLGNLTYGYDADGRVTSKGGTLAATGLPNSVSGNTFNADNGMTGFGGATLSYDANGNLISDGTNSYTWDARNHLAAISGPTTASFTYDAFGRRASKSFEGTTTSFLYDDLNLVQELESEIPSGNLLTGLDVDEYLTNADSSNNVSTLLADALGSTIGLVGAAQRIQTSYTYQPFGGTSAEGSTNGNSYQFSGRENDGTGLYFYRTRYYSPSLQRFIGQDPIGFAAGDPNLYGYALSNPVTLKDPSGRFVPLIVLAIGGVFGGGAAAYSNYGAYSSGAITGGQYFEAIAFGAATGVLAAIPTGIVGSIVAGALGSAANNLIDQGFSQPCDGLNLSTAGEAGLFGALGGAIAGGLGALGEKLMIPVPSIGETLPEVSGGYPTPGYTTLGTPGGIVGNAIGTGAGAYLGP
jgi:RHS repeat-associated protein